MSRTESTKQKIYKKCAYFLYFFIKKNNSKVEFKIR